MATKKGTRKAKGTVTIKPTDSPMMKMVKSRSIKTNYTIRINTEIGEKFKEYCKKNGISMSEMVEEFFRKELGL